MKSFRYAAARIVPLLLTYIFVGIASGILFHQAGFDVWLAALAAAFIYAGSMQIVLVSLFTAGMPLIAIGLMTLFVNARHIFYGIGFIDKFKKMGGWKYPYMVLTQTDETYSVLCSLDCPEDVDESQVMFYIQLLCHLIWIVSCTAGALMGELLPFDSTGIDFSATAFFTVVVVNQWMTFPSRIPAVTGFVCAILFWLLLGPDQFILPALSVSMVVLAVLKQRVEGQMGGAGNE